MLYKINLYVLDNKEKVVEDTIKVKESKSEMTVKELKQFANKGKYKNISSEEFMVHHVIKEEDTDLIDKPFILYTIKLS
jgi:hypothetical protein